MDNFLHFFTHLWRKLFFGASGLGVLFHVLYDEIFGDLVDVAASAEDNVMGLLGILEEVFLLLIMCAGGVDLDGSGFGMVFIVCGF